MQVRIAEALVDAINAITTWNKQLKAQRHWLFDITPENLTENRRVVVFPPADDDTIESMDINSGRRGHLQNDYPMRLVYQAKVPDAIGRAEAFDDWCDNESYTVDQLFTMFAFDRYTLSALTSGQQKYWVTDCQIRKAFDTEQMRQNAVFEAELLVTVRTWRQS